MLVIRLLRNKQHQHVENGLGVGRIECDRQSEPGKDCDGVVQTLDPGVWNRDTTPQARGPKCFALGETRADLFRGESVARFQEIRDGLEGVCLVRGIEVENYVVI